MIRHIKFAMFTAALIASQTAMASELEWRLVSAASRGFGGVSCDTNSVSLTSAGNDVSLVMSTMNITMPAGEQAKIRSQWGSCFVHLSVKIPQGYTISTNQTTLLGGILKDSGASGYLDVVSMFTQRRRLGLSPFVVGAPALGPVNHIYRGLRFQEEINEPLFDLNKTSTFTRSQKMDVCRLTAKQPAELGYYVQISLAASRSYKLPNVIMNLDNLDGHFNLQTNAEACSRI